MRIGFHDRNKSLAGERMTWMTEVLKSPLFAPSSVRSRSTLPHLRFVERFQEIAWNALFGSSHGL